MADSFHRLQKVVEGQLGEEAVRPVFHFGQDQVEIGFLVAFASQFHLLEGVDQSPNASRAADPARGQFPVGVIPFLPVFTGGAVARHSISAEGNNWSTCRRQV